MAKSDLETTREEAWIGDAVLSLYVRRWILAERGAMDGEMHTRLTSNAFLASVGNPTSVEAHIGRLHEREGLDAANRWIEDHLLPVFRRQEANRRKH